LKNRCLAGIFFVLHLAAAPLRADEEHFAHVVTGFSARIGDGSALFLPAGLTPGSLPLSLILLSRPRTLRPIFSRSASRTRLTLAVPAGTSLYGTGEVTGPLLRNGRTITLWNTDNFKYETDGGRRLYQSHPWVLGVRRDGSAFGVIADSPWAAELSLQGGITFTSDGPAFPVIIIDRDSPQDVIRSLAALTGTMPLPPRWALGYQQCRWSYDPDARVRQIADEFRRRRIPCDVIWMDIDYMDAFRVFTFSPTEFPDPKALNAYLHARGFKSVWMIDPGVKAEPGYRIYDSGTAADVWVHDAQGRVFRGEVWPRVCVFPDFTRPETRSWWSANYLDFMRQGVDGVWNDMNEPSVFDGPDKTMPRGNWHRGGDGLPAGPHAQYHNVFGMLMARATREGIAAANPGKRPFVLSRSNFLGGQRYAATWTGDNASTWDYLRMAIPMTLNLGLSGQPFNGPDLGGFADNPTPELWGQWVAMGAFFPFCRGHGIKGSVDKEPWAFGPEVESAARIALERRYRLLPYLYTLFYQSSLDGSPVMDPVFFADLRDPSLRAEDREFLLGRDLLIVPKWANHPRPPGGIWRSFSLVDGDLGDKYQAGLRIRGGAIIPLGRVIQNTTEESLDPLTLLVSPDARGNASGQLFEDAGDGYGYRDGDYLLTAYRAERRGNAVVVSVAHEEGRRRRPERVIVVQVVADGGVFTASGRDGSPIVVPLPQSLTPTGGNLAESRR
jgi:alpha-glucosidase